MVVSGLGFRSVHHHLGLASLLSCFSGSYNVIRGYSSALALPMNLGLRAGHQAGMFCPLQIPAGPVLPGNPDSEQRSLGHLRVSVRDSVSKANRWPQSPQRKHSAFSFAWGCSLPQSLPFFLLPPPLLLVKPTLLLHLPPFLPPFLYQHNHVCWSTDHVGEALN